MLSRLARLDRLLLLTLVPLWLLGFGFHLQALGSGLSWVPVYITPDAEGGYPRVQGFWPDADKGGLEVGDRILRAGSADLRGVGRLTFVGHVSTEAAGAPSVRLQIEREGARSEHVFPLPAVASVWFHPFMSLAFGLVGTLVLLRAPSVAASRPFFLACLFYALHWCYFFGGGITRTVASLVVFLGSSYGFKVFAIYALQRLGDEPRRAGLGSKLWPWVFVASGLSHTTWVLGVPLPSSWGQNSAMLWNVVFIGVALVVAAQSYRSSSPRGQRQLRWALTGIYIGFVVPLAASFVVLARPELRWVYEVALPSVLAVPLFVAFSIARFNLFDIDRVISATASYTILGVVLMAGLLAGLPSVAEAASSSMGVSSTTAQLAVGVVLAVVAVPTHRALRPRLDRMFFPDRCSLHEAVQRLLGELHAQEDPRALTSLAGSQLDLQFHPESCVVYARSGAGFEPMFTRGRAVPPAIEGRTRLIQNLEVRRSPLTSERDSPSERIGEVDAFDRAILDTLGAAVVVPVHRKRQLVAFLCLGRKGSGDIYTSTDLALLAVVANVVSSQLERMNQEELARQAREMQHELRRFVPGAVAQQVEEGADLAPRERTVSVLFVDIRGYVEYSQSRRPEEIFSTVNRYTQTVSAIVQKFGGSVVEFNGDGMMAVFGAPTPLGDKERAALNAGREIVARIPTAVGPSALSVGVGIATGLAFVGSIQAVDRQIWTALGNTTNLAARLQGLTRELNAAIVTDLPTWRAAGEPPEFQRRDRITIRGRSHSEDLFVLPIAAET